MSSLSCVGVCAYVYVHPHTHAHSHGNPRPRHETTLFKSMPYTSVSRGLGFVLTVFLFFKVFSTKKKKKESVLGTENSSVTASSTLLHRGQESVSINRKKMMGMEPLSIYNVDNRPDFGLNMCPFLGTSRLPFLILFCFTQLFGPNGQPPARAAGKPQ